VSEQTADALGVAAGQRVRVATANGARDMVVSGTARTLASAQSDLPDDQAAALLGLSGRSNALFVAASDTAAQILRDRPEVARVTSLATARSGMHDLVRCFGGLPACCSLALPNWAMSVPSAILPGGAPAHPRSVVTSVLPTWEGVTPQHTWKQHAGGGTGILECRRRGRG
jgi:hypothetical protein